MAGFAKLWLGAILISAGLLKLHELLLYRGGWGALGVEADFFETVAPILLELFAGFFFLVSRPQKLLWLTGLTILAVFALYNCMLLAEDRPSCGCFGVISVSPWFSLSFDLVGVGLLLATYGEVPRIEWRELFSLRVALRPALYAVSLAAACSLVEQSLYLSPVGVRIRGETVTVIPESLWLGEVAKGRLHEARIGVRNNADRPIMLVGGTTNCSCYAIKGLPVSLQSGETRYVPVDVRVPARSGSFALRLKLYADLGGVRVVRCQVKGRAVVGTSVALSDSHPQKSVKGERR